MDALQYSSEAWNGVTVMMNFLAVAILMFCLARRRFFRIVPRQLHPASQTVQLDSHNRPDSNRLPGTERRPSAGTMDSLRRPIGWSRRGWRALITPRCTLDTTCARFAMFLTLLTSLLFVTSTFIAVAGMGLNSDPVGYILPNQPLNTTVPLEALLSELPVGCQAVEYMCIFSYGSTKVFMYWFFIERVYIVSCSGTVPRLTTKTYKAGIAGLIIYAAILFLLSFSRINFLVPVVSQSSNSPSVDPASVFAVGMCTVGLHLYGVLPVLVYETIVTVVLTAMFIIPITTSGGQGHQRKPWLQIPSEQLKRLCNPTFTPVTSFFNFMSLLPNIRIPLPPLATAMSPTTTRRTTEIPTRDVEGQFTSTIGLSSLVFDTKHQSLELRKLAKRSLIWSLPGLVVAFANITVLVSRGGQQEGATCVRWCVADVVVNALAVFMVMGGKDEWCMRSASIQRSGGVCRDARSQEGQSSRIERGRRDTVGLQTYTLTTGSVGLISTSPRFLPDELISPISLPPPALPSFHPNERNMSRRSKCISLDVYGSHTLHSPSNPIIYFGRHAERQHEAPLIPAPEEVHLHFVSRHHFQLWSTQIVQSTDGPSPSRGPQYLPLERRWSSEDLQPRIKH